MRRFQQLSFCIRMRTVTFSHRSVRSWCPSVLRTSRAVGSCLSGSLSSRPPAARGLSALSESSISQGGEAGKSSFQVMVISFKRSTKKVSATSGAQGLASRHCTHHDDAEFEFLYCCGEAECCLCMKVLGHCMSKSCLCSACVLAWSVATGLPDVGQSAFGVACLATPQLVMNARHLPGRLLVPREEHPGRTPGPVPGGPSASRRPNKKKNSVTCSGWASSPGTVIQTASIGDAWQ